MFKSQSSKEVKCRSKCTTENSEKANDDALKRKLQSRGFIVLAYQLVAHLMKFISVLYFEVLE